MLESVFFRYRGLVVEQSGNTDLYILAAHPGSVDIHFGENWSNGLESNRIPSAGEDFLLPARSSSEGMGAVDAGQPR